MDHEQTGYRLYNTRCGDEQPVSKGGCVLPTQWLSRSPASALRTYGTRYLAPSQTTESRL